VSCYTYKFLIFYSSIVSEEETPTAQANDQRQMMSLAPNAGTTLYYPPIPEWIGLGEREKME